LRNENAHLPLSSSRRRNWSPGDRSHHFAPQPAPGRAIVVFIAGALIRIKIEDSLLESQFGAEFVDYRQSVPGMLPFLK
jgi:hypothetical protein